MWPSVLWVWSIMWPSVLCRDGCGQSCDPLYYAEMGVVNHVTLCTMHARDGCGLWPPILRGHSYCVLVHGMPQWEYGTSTWQRMLPQSSELHISLVAVVVWCACSLATSPLHLARFMRAARDRSGGEGRSETAPLPTWIPTPLPLHVHRLHELTSSLL